MNNMQKRFVLFLFGCIPTRLALAYLAKNIAIDYLPILGCITLIIGISFGYLFLNF